MNRVVKAFTLADSSGNVVGYGTEYWDGYSFVHWDKTPMPTTPYSVYKSVSSRTTAMKRFGYTLTYNSAFIPGTVAETFGDEF